MLPDSLYTHSQKPRFEEVANVMSFLDRNISHPFWLLLRWSWYPLYNTDQRTEEFSEAGLLGFQALCTAGFLLLCSLVVIGLLFLGKEPYHYPHVLVWMCAGYAVATAIRIGIWFRYEYDDEDLKKLFN